MAVLSSAGRRKLPTSAFALPGRRYPIHDINHAHAALSYVSRYGTSAEKSAVRSAVRKRFPRIKQHAVPGKRAQVNGSTNKSGAMMGPMGKVEQ